MSDHSGSGRYRIGRIREIVVLSLVLSVGVVGFEFLVHVVSAHATGGVGHGLRDIVISLPMAVAAVGIGLWLGRRLGYQGTGALAALNRSAIVSVVFGVALIPSVGIHGSIDSFFGDGGVDSGDHLTGLSSASEYHLIQTLTATGGRASSNGSVWGLVQDDLNHGFHDALMGLAVGLPLLFVAFLLLDRLQARRREPPPRVIERRRLPRVAYVAAAVATITWVGSVAADRKSVV